MADWRFVQIVDAIQNLLVTAGLDHRSADFGGKLRSQAILA